MRFQSVTFFLIIFAFTGCVAGKKQTGFKYDGHSYGRLFAIASTADLEARVRLEKEVAALADTNGYKVVKCMDVIPPSIQDPVPPTKEELMIQAKKSGCDAFFIVYFMNTGETATYVGGEQHKGTESWLGGLGMQVSVGRRGIGNADPTNKYKKDVSIPGYYSKGKGFYLLSVLYDVSSEQVVFSDRSEEFKEAELVSYSSVYFSELMKRMQKEKILMK